MQHKSTYDLKIGNALIQQIDVMADIERADDGDWYVGAVYADALEIDGECPQGDAYVEIPGDHYLHNSISMHFLTECHDDIQERWSRHSRQPAFTYAYSAGRTL